jgi:hypothetical protein
MEVAARPRASPRVQKPMLKIPTSVVVVVVVFVAVPAVVFVICGSEVESVAAGSTRLRVVCRGVRFFRGRAWGGGVIDGPRRLASVEAAGLPT